MSVLVMRVKNESIASLCVDAGMEVVSVSAMLLLRKHPIKDVYLGC